MQCSTEAWLLWILWIGEGVRDYGEKFRAPYSQTNTSKISLLQFIDLVGREGSADSTSMTGCQDQFNSHNGRKGHLTSVIFSNMLQSCCWLAPLKHFPLWIAQSRAWMLSLVQGLLDVVRCFKTLVKVHCYLIFSRIIVWNVEWEKSSTAERLSWFRVLFRWALIFEQYKLVLPPFG